VVRAVLVGLSVGGGGVLAQGGPPLVTDDPETPGANHWEINVAAFGDHTSAGWQIAAPNLDINFGWGDHVQLTLQVPWNVIHESGETWRSGLGTSQVGVKWRFLDIEDAGFSMATFPQFSWNWSPSSVSRGLAAPGSQFFLPLEAATTVGEFTLATELGRNFVTEGPNEWLGGIVVAHSCGDGLECVAELHHTSVPHNSQTLADVGIHWQLSEFLSVLAGAGREFGRSTADQSHFHFFLGLQILR